MAIHESEIEHSHVDHTMRIQIGFEPSDKLDAALQRFLLPEKRDRRAFIFQSWLSKNIPIVDSTNDGAGYLPVHAEQLVNDRKRLSQIESQQIVVGPEPKCRMLPNGDIELGIDALPNERQRRCLGGFVLDQWDRQQPLILTARLPQSSLLKEADRGSAWRELATDFRLNHPTDQYEDYETAYKVKNKKGQIYVSRPRLTERLNVSRMPLRKPQ